MSYPNMGYWCVAQTKRVVPKAEGLQGTGKTVQNCAFLRSLGYAGYVCIGSIREPADVGGYPYVWTDAESGRQSMHLVPPKFVVDAWSDHAKGQPFGLFLDELTCCPPAVQAAMLRIMAERVVGDMPLPPQTIIVAACNPPGIAANGFELEPPMANRLCHLKWETDWDTWESGMAAGMEFPDPKFLPLDPDWEQNHLPRLANLVAGYRKRKPSAFELSEQDIQDRTKLGGPHPTMRSWTNGAICMAAVEGCGAPQEVRFQVLAGCVGEEAAQGFFDWERELDLPDPEKTIQDAIKANKAGRPFTMPLPARCDQIMVFLGAITERVRQQNTKERFEGADAVFSVVAQSRYKDLAASCAPPLAKIIPQGARFSPAFVQVVLPMLQAAGIIGK